MHSVDNNPTERRHGVTAGAPRGFTLVEMLVVVVIIIGLLSILVPAITSVTATAGQVAEKQFLGAIQVALKNYQLDHESYPPSDTTDLADDANLTTFGMTQDLFHDTYTGPGGNVPYQGAELLVQALLGPRNSDGTNGDGLNGYGFKQGGRSYGPYLAIKHENTLVIRDSPAPNQPWRLAMVSSQSKAPILYYRADSAGATGKFKPAAAGSNDPHADNIWGIAGRFNVNDNRFLHNNGGGDWTDPTDFDFAKEDPTDHWYMTAPEQEVESLTFSLRSAQYLLVSPGPDEHFGNKSYDNTTSASTTQNDLDYDDQILASD